MTEATRCWGPRPWYCLTWSPAQPTEARDGVGSSQPCWLSHLGDSMVLEMWPPGDKGTDPRLSGLGCSPGRHPSDTGGWSPSPTPVCLWKLSPEQALLTRSGLVSRDSILEMQHSTQRSPAETPPEAIPRPQGQEWSSGGERHRELPPKLTEAHRLL